MSIIEDDLKMQAKYGFNKITLDKDKYNFRMDLLTEEFNELMEANATKNPEEIVDALIDLIVIAVGTLSLTKVDVQKAWSEVFKANMNKTVGIKPGREQSEGFDLTKNPSWTPPSHKNNHGDLHLIFNLSGDCCEN